jgi:hypothetical protein
MPTFDYGVWVVLTGITHEPVDSQVTAIHAHLIPILTESEEHPKAKVLYWHARFASLYTFENPPNAIPNFLSCLFDPETNEIVQYFIPKWTQNIGDNIDPSKLFCSGHTHLEDGKLLTAGGERNQPPWGVNGTKYSFLFDSSTLNDTDPRPWKITKNGSNIQTLMTNGRWYPQLTKRHNGTVIAMSGNPDVPPGVSDPPVVIYAELFNPNTQEWTEINEEGAEFEVPLYVGAYLIPFGEWEGQIFYDMVAFGPELEDWKGSHRFNPEPSTPGDYWNPIGSQEKTLRLHGSSVMLPISSSDVNIRIINLGGFGDHSNTSELIEVGEKPNTDWIKLNDLNYDRHDCPNALLLADATLIVIGGGDETMAVMETEKLDYSDPNPSNWHWIVLDDNPKMHVPRRYHSTALLLQDARVWVGGSRLYNEPQRFEFENDMERRIEFYEPAYLHDGERPIITEAPLIINYGEQNKFLVRIDVSEDPEILLESIVLISLPSVTHCFDSNQRYIILDILHIDDETYEVTPPENNFIAPPGYYMLFVLKDKSQSESGENRIPSVAKIVKLEEIK